jgi:segregation and condensation protein B
MNKEKIKSSIESILFVSGEPIKISRLAKIIKVKVVEIEEAIKLLQEEYAHGRGMNIIRKEDAIQMVTSADNSEIVSRLLKSEIQENLSQASLEVLSVVAYRGPIARADIEAIRGVNCSFTLRTLMLRGLLERVDNPENNRSYLYKISFEFLKKLGIDDIKKLPDWEVFSRDQRIDKIINK